eukprot:scaffold216673_cov31-Prasinocladus_malaysianus.AAC.1
MKDWRKAFGMEAGKNLCDILCITKLPPGDSVVYGNIDHANFLVSKSGNKDILARFKHNASPRFECYTHTQLDILCSSI